jgi:GntR family transcriptional regulator, transcriptional repressor for pyruvate dehydrogenase complex
MRKIPINLIAPVRVQSVADHVVEQIERLINDGRFAPGDQLPPEAELSAALGVGRSTVREAKQTLIAKGLVVAHGRIGAFIADPVAPDRKFAEVARALRDPSHRDIHEVRQIVEIAACRLAAERVTSKAIATMRATLADIERQSAEQASEAWPRSLEIHRQIVQASGNEVLASLYDLIAQVLNRNQVPYLPLIASWPTEIDSHRRLIDVLEQGNPDTMAVEMTDHLANADKYRHDLLASGILNKLASEGHSLSVTAAADW